MNQRQAVEVGEVMATTLICRSSALLVRWRAEAALIFTRLANAYLGAGLFGPAARLKAKAEQLYKVVLTEIGELTDADADLIATTITELEEELQRLAGIGEQWRTGSLTAELGYIERGTRADVAAK